MVWFSEKKVRTRTPKKNSLSFYGIRFLFASKRQTRQNTVWQNQTNLSNNTKRKHSETSEPQHSKGKAMKNLVIVFTIIISLLYIRLSAANPAPLAHITPQDNLNPAMQPVKPDQTEQKQPHIQVALLLDTSGSMSGLIEQAKSQLWKIVNELATAKQNGLTPNLELALYEYGKSSIPQKDGYIRRIVPLTTDLDQVSEELFKLTTNGGDEYCGEVIQRSHNELKWTNSPSDLKMVFIAGNEPFNQGSVDYKKACKSAIGDGIIVNTIFCGPEQEGISTFWKDGADLADGSYMNIDHNQQTVYIDAPQDAEIKRLNDELNETYIAFGSTGRAKKERQLEQDKNAANYGSANVAQRAMSKSTAYYDNSSWDMVDAADEDDFDVEEIEEEELPEEMQGMTKAEKEAFIEEKSEERARIQKEIQALNKEREKYVAEKKAEMSNNDPSLDGVMVESIKSRAAKKNFKFE